jgi:hypothetical protein
MANTGYITSSGIIQIFTTGPYSGSEVTSSYSDGSTLFGGILNTFQPFISGDLDIITPCETDNIIPGINSFERFYYDPAVCPPDGICLAPTFTSAQRNTCISSDPSTYNITWSSGSSTADYTIIEYSIFSNFSSTGSVILDNSNYTSSINVLINGFPPQSTSPIYFRAYNSCSNGSNSLYSQTIIANNCVITTPIYSDFTFNIVNQSGCTVETTNGTSTNTGPYISVPQNTIGNSYNFNTSTRNFFFKVASPTSCPNNRVYIELSTTSPNIEGNVITNISGVDSGNCIDNMGIQTAQYNSSPILLQYPTSNLLTQIATNIFINRESWFTGGNITLTIKLLPSNNDPFNII